jgi:hypothetical protein
MKNSNNTIGDRTRDLPACSAVPQLTALPLTPYSDGVGFNNLVQLPQLQCKVVTRHTTVIAGVANMLPSSELFAAPGELNIFKNIA